MRSRHVSPATPRASFHHDPEWPMTTLRHPSRLALCCLLVPALTACFHDSGEIVLCVKRPDDVQKAIDACTRLIDHPPLVDPDRYGWFAARANHKLLANDVDGALADVDEAIRLRPNDPQLYSIRADVHRRKGDAAAADRDEQRARSPAPQAGSSSPQSPRKATPDRT